VWTSPTRILLYWHSGAASRFVPSTARTFPGCRASGLSPRCPDGWDLRGDRGFCRDCWLGGGRSPGAACRGDCRAAAGAPGCDQDGHPGRRHASRPVAGALRGQTRWGSAASRRRLRLPPGSGGTAPTCSIPRRRAPESPWRDRPRPADRRYGQARSVCAGKAGMPELRAGEVRGNGPPAGQRVRGRRPPAQGEPKVLRFWPVDHSGRVTNPLEGTAVRLNETRWSWPPRGPRRCPRGRRVSRRCPGSGSAPCPRPASLQRPRPEVAGCRRPPAVPFRAPSFSVSTLRRRQLRAQTEIAAYAR